jgi:hypothetical protein
MIISGPFLSQDKLISLITISKTLYNQIKEFFKSPKFNTIVTQSTQQRQFCEQLRLISDSIANTDILITVICQKLIVKILTGNDDQQQSQNKIEDVNDGLIIAVYGSVLQQLATMCTKNFRDKSDNTRDSQTIKVNLFILIDGINTSQYRNDIYSLNGWIV